MTFSLEIKSFIGRVRCFVPRLFKFCNHVIRFSCSKSGNDQCFRERHSVFVLFRPSPLAILLLSLTRH